jgi:SAM-dependent methyltransferase
MAENRGASLGKGPAAIYDRIGEGYVTHRRPDPRIFRQIERALAGCATIVNVGAGAGSYETSTCTLAIEPSRRMIEQRPLGAAMCVQAAAEALPLPDRSFDGALASLTIHHWKDFRAGLGELRRVARKRVVLFTWDTAFPLEFWLTRDYLPRIFELDRSRYPALPDICRILGPARSEIVAVPADCEDGFMGAFWKRPAAYLDPEVRRSNSVMAQLDPAYLAAALSRLREDLQTGAWSRRNAELAPTEELDLGYRLVVAELG